MVLDDCLRALRWRIGVAMLGVDTGTVDMVYSSSQHCGGDGRWEGEGEEGGGGGRGGSRKAVEGEREVLEQMYGRKKPEILSGRSSLTSVRAI